MIVVCKKYRLLEKSDGKFKVNEHRKELRSSVKIEKSYVDAQNKLSKITGIVYEVDEKATKDRDEKLNPKEKTEKEELQEKATELGIEFDGRTSVAKLKELIEEKQG